MKFGLDEKDWKLIEELAIKPLKSRGADVWIFGSRARGDQKTYSDLDILYEAQEDLKFGDLALIQENLEESNLAVKVELVSRSDLAEAYRNQIEKEKVAV